MATRNWRRWVIGGVAAILLVVVAAPFIYIHFIQADPPARLSFSNPPTGTKSTSAGGIEGTWTPTSASSVGYRINELLMGQKSEAVGRTSKVTGQLIIAGTTVNSASFTVDMTSVVSDDDRRDQQFQGRIMETSTYPTATFALSAPISLTKVPADQEIVSVTVAGKLTMHGVTKTVSLPLKAKRNASTIEVNGSLAIVFADWGIGNPSFGPVTTEDHGLLEFLVVFGQS